MRREIFPRAAVLLAVMLAAATVLGACGDSEPEAVEFELAIADGALDLDPPVLKVKQGDEVTLKVRSDKEGELHLHGYDLDVGLVPGSVAELVFTANATGKFDFELHLAHGDEEEHEEEHEKGEEPINLGSLEVHPR